MSGTPQQNRMGANRETRRIVRLVVAFSDRARGLQWILPDDHRLYESRPREDPRVDPDLVDLYPRDRRWP